MLFYRIECNEVHKILRSEIRVLAIHYQRNNILDETSGIIVKLGGCLRPKVTNWLLLDIKKVVAATRREARFPLAANNAISGAEMALRLLLS